MSYLVWDWKMRQLHLSWPCWGTNLCFLVRINYFPLKVLISLWWRAPRGLLALGLSSSLSSSLASCQGQLHLANVCRGTFGDTQTKFHFLGVSRVFQGVNEFWFWFCFFSTVVLSTDTTSLAMSKCLFFLVQKKMQNCSIWFAVCVDKGEHEMV